MKMYRFIKKPLMLVLTMNFDNEGSDLP